MRRDCVEERYIKSGSVLSNECHHEIGHCSFLEYGPSFIIQVIFLSAVKV
jgi:hypothetical protein